MSDREGEDMNAERNDMNQVKRTSGVGAACIAAVLFVTAANAQRIPTKQVAAPPADIVSGRVRLPEASALVERSRVAWIPIDFARDGDAWRFRREVPIEAARDDGTSELGVLVLGPGGEAWRVDLRGPDELAHQDTALRVARGAARSDAGPFVGMADGGADAARIGARRVDIDGARAGQWSVEVSARAGASPTERAPEQALLAVTGGGRVRLASRLSTLELCAESEIAFVAWAFDEAAGEAPLFGAIEAASARVETARGALELTLFDDGLHADGAALDGVFGAFLPAGTSGAVGVWIEASGVTGQGAFARTTRHAFTVVERGALFDGSVAVRPRDALRVDLELGVDDLTHGTLHASAEVWGRTAGGAPLPVCWLSRMVEVRPASATGGAGAGVGDVVTLTLDARWIELAGAVAPFELRRVRLQDPDTNVPYDRRARLALPAFELPSGVGAGVPGVTRDMLAFPVGSIATTRLAAHQAAPAPVEDTSALMRVHGYCSGGNVWPSSDFSQPTVVFLDPNQNRSHDAFAQLLQQFGSNLWSYGIVGHSQGGAAAVHLLTYYQSGLDNAEGERLIQSLATPYQGTPLASLGGFSCGVNNDMTPTGSATWLAGIPTWARQEVWYWTTSNPRSGSDCVPFIWLFLGAPNDGTTEQSGGQFPGANNMGHTEGWCHTTGMSYPAGYTDAMRNADIDANAAR